MSELDQARRLLRETFGFDDFREGQERVVSTLLGGRSALAVFPTGGGKSLCYQLPALALDGLTVVVSPLIALMKDQIDFLTRHGVAAARLDSSLDAVEARQVLSAVRGGDLKLLYVSPERLAGGRFVQTLAGRNVVLLAVDEAHCISEWGHNFRPEYMKLARIAREIRAERVLALTATATPEVARDIARAFEIDGRDVVITGFHRPNLELHATPCGTDERRAELLGRLKAGGGGPAIVYVTLQRTAEELAEFLAGQGLDAEAYHAGLPDDRRHAIQDRFMASESGVVVATIAFGMGIDKGNLRAVYHYNLPKSLENYAQEIGRAGRDGGPARCELFACAEDVVTLENFTFGDTPTPEAIGSFLDEVLGQVPQFDVSAYDLSQAHDIRPLVVQTLLTYLELEGVIEATGPSFAEYKFQPLRPSAEILARFDEHRASFLRGIFRQARKGKIWFTIDTQATALALAEPRERITAALNHLEERGDLKLQVSGVRHGYRRTGPEPDMDRLRETLVGRFIERENRDIARVQKVLDYARSPACLTGLLLAYFGESLPGGCGHCDRCLGHPPRPLPEPARHGFGTHERQAIERIRAEGHRPLQTARALGRFLCGLSSPATTRAKLSKHPSFGLYAERPFLQVLAFVESLEASAPKLR